jgi:hypothetical protein
MWKGQVIAFFLGGGAGGGGGLLHVGSGLLCFFITPP